jgi:dinuclear metal center YbgI/SA1388 family protein
MKISQVISFLETLAPPSLQESYDNAGLITGDRNAECRGILVSLDATEEVIREAIAKDCNLVVAHHPIIFKGLKRLTGSNYVERAIIRAIRGEVAIYAIHTNLDNMLAGVSGYMAKKLELQNIRILQPREQTLKKLYTYVPLSHLEQVRLAIFEAGGGGIGNYSECSFSVEGTGTFKAGEGTRPFVGEQGIRHVEKEMKLEIIFPGWLEKNVVGALRQAHPYEEVAFEVIRLDNRFSNTGAGVIGEWKEALGEKEFLDKLHRVFRVQAIRHTPLRDKPVQRVALCGGAGSFLISRALSQEADAYISADIRYHEFFDAEGRMLITDIGHYESEQFTIDLLKEEIEQKFPNFAVLKTGVNTNPVQYSWR